MPDIRQVISGLISSYFGILRGQDTYFQLNNMNDSPARTDPEEAEIGRPTQTGRRLVEASVSPNTRRAYAGALRGLDAWLDGRALDDAALAAYLAELHDAGRASSSASMAVAAACFRAKLAGQPTPAGERTARVLAGDRRTAGDRGRGQARPFGVSDLAAVLATWHRPRRRGRCQVESDQVALERGRVDAVIAGLLFMAGMRRSEVSALRWAIRPTATGSLSRWCRRPIRAWPKPPRCCRPASRSCSPTCPERPQPCSRVGCGMLRPRGSYCRSAANPTCGSPPGPSVLPCERAAAEALQRLFRTTFRVGFRARRV